MTLNMAIGCQLCTIGCVRFAETHLYNTFAYFNNSYMCLFTIDVRHRCVARTEYQEHDILLESAFSTSQRTDRCSSL